MSIKSRIPGIASDMSGVLIANQRQPNYMMGKKDNNMPLNKGKEARTNKGFSENVKELTSTGKYPQKQAVAIAYSQARHSKKHSSSHHRHKEHR